MIPQPTDEIPEGALEMPAARAHLCKTIGKKEFFTPRHGVNVLEADKFGCGDVYHYWNKAIKKYDFDKGEHLSRYIHGREICVPLYSLDYKFGFEDWRHDPHCECPDRPLQPVSRATMAHEAGYSPLHQSPSTPLMSPPSKGTSTATYSGASTPAGSPASAPGPSRHRIVLTPVGLSPFRRQYKSMDTDPNSAAINKNGDNPTKYCSCALAKYQGDGVFAVVKSHDTGCECNIDLNCGWPVDMHWELTHSPKRIQPRTKVGRGKEKVVALAPVGYQSGDDGDDGDSSSGNSFYQFI
jgi:hypothetical protein